MDEEFLPRILEFFRTNLPFAIALVVALALNAFRIRTWWIRTREILDPARTPDWADRETSTWRGRASGRWQGRSVTLRRLRSQRRSHTLFEATLETSSPGAFAIERGDLGVLRRGIRFGGPPRIDPIRPEDQREFRVFADDRNQADRVLADSAVRDALGGILAGDGDELSLRRGRLRVRRRVLGDNPAGPAVEAAWNLLKGTARVVG